MRKGLTILIATPGRLHDHLAHTASLNVNLLRWLVLDEADRLLDFGFAPKVNEIIALIEEKRRRAYANLHADMSNHDAPPFQRILCSATISKEIEELAAETLVNPRIIDADATAAVELEEVSLRGAAVGAAAEGGAEGGVEGGAERTSGGGGGEFAVPRQLQQFYVEVAERQRLLALIGCIHHLLVVPTTKKGKSTVKSARKVVIFASTRAGVDLVHTMLQRVFAGALTQPEDAPSRGSGGAGGSSAASASMSVYRLHGTIDSEERATSLREFCEVDADAAAAAKASSVLVCTDVAARGLNLPHVDWIVQVRSPCLLFPLPPCCGSCNLCCSLCCSSLLVFARPWIVQYDPPSELSDYIHRIGRTARSGRSGCSLLFVLPAERAYVDLLHAKQRAATAPPAAGANGADGAAGVKEAEAENEIIRPLSLGSLLAELRALTGVVTLPSKRGGGGAAAAVERATSMACARMQRALFATVETDPLLHELAKRAYLAWVRAYTTHSRGTKHIFTLRAVHLGHIARSFALKEQPKSAAEKIAAEKAEQRAREDGTYRDEDFRKGPLRQKRAAGGAQQSAEQRGAAMAAYNGKGSRPAAGVEESETRQWHNKRLSLAAKEENESGISDKRSTRRWMAHDEFAM